MKPKNENPESELQGIGATKPADSREEHADPKPATCDFHPIRIKGEPLSVIILRDRR